MEMLTFKDIDFISNILYYQWEDFMFQWLISVHIHTPKCAIPEKIQFYFVFKFHMLFLWYPWKFHFPILFGFFLEYPICHFTLGNFRENKTSSLDIPHSCVAHFGNSKAKYQDRWNFHMIFSRSLLEIPLLFQLTCGISTCSFFNTLGHSISSNPPTRIFLPPPPPSSAKN